MWYFIYGGVFLLSLLLSLVLTEIVKNYAINIGFVDKPNKRKFHKGATPLLGGVAIYLSFTLTIIIGVIVFFCGFKYLPASIQDFLGGIQLRLPWVFAILVGGLVLAITGLIDDKVNLGPWIKLFIQFLVAVFVISMGIKVRLFLRAEWLSYIITVIWIMFLTNAFNLLDNMDGVSAGVALVSSFMLFLVACLLGEFFIATILTVFMGSLLGFLYFNFPPAKIFMGDCGSMFIGFLLSIMTILGTYYKPNSPTLFPVAIPLIVLAVPIFDTISVICIRLWNGQHIFKADKNHFSHRLVNLKMKVPLAVCFVYLVSLCLGLPSVLLPILPLGGVLIVFAQAFIVMVIIAILEYYAKNSRFQ